MRRQGCQEAGAIESRAVLVPSPPFYYLFYIFNSLCIDFYRDKKGEGQRETSGERALPPLDGACSWARALDWELNGNLLVQGRHPATEPPGPGHSFPISELNEGLVILL